MITIIAKVDGQELETTFDTTKIEALETFVAEHFCGKFFFEERPDAAREIARLVISRKGQIDENTDFDGFRFNNAPNRYEVLIEIVV